MRILVTNDDGIAAPGIRELARAAHELGHDVVVAAPQAEASGMSAALSAVTQEGRIVIALTELDGLPGVPAFGVAASPAYIAVLGSLGAFGPPPGLLLSGINRGANAGHAVLHSGTVGAALTAANHGISALAVSLDVPTPSDGSSATGGAAVAELDPVGDETRHWATAAGLACRLLPWLDGAPAGTVLNLNVPDRPIAAVAGLREAAMAPFGQVQMTLAESGDGFVRTVVEAHGPQDAPGTDVSLLADGYATVTAIRPPERVPGLTVPTDL